ncbi:MAG: ChaN family lipoprotein [Nitrospirota bacterium]|nr:ChaN family lipoprotein [Nitrospirota bacterium]
MSRLFPRPAALSALFLLFACASGPVPLPHAVEGHMDLPQGHPSPHGHAAATEDSETASAPGFEAFAASSPYRDIDSLSAGSIVHLPTGRQVSETQLLDLLADHRVVFVGEMHTSLEDHRIQLLVLKALEARKGGQVMVGLEMFPHTAQADLDRWVAGQMDEAAFLKVWYRHWSEDWEYYAPIMRYARERHIPLIALNATREEVKAVSSGEAEVPVVDPMLAADPYHEAYMTAILGGHGHGGSGGFGRVQRLWEATMAEYAARALEREPRRTLLVLAGAGHVQYGFGIPRQLFARVPVSYTTLVPVTVSMPAEREELQMDVDMPDFPMPYADFVWAVDYRDREGERVMLGVSLDPRDDGLFVRGVLPGSPAADAGVAEGDRLVSLDGNALSDMADVKAAMTVAVEGHNGILVVARSGTEHTLSIAYRKPAPLPEGHPLPGEADDMAPHEARP